MRWHHNAVDSYPYETGSVHGSPNATLSRVSRNLLTWKNSLGSNQKTSLVLGFVFLVLAFLNLFSQITRPTGRWEWFLVASWFVVGSLHCGKVILFVAGRDRRE